MFAFNQLLPALRMLTVTTVLTGAFYPLVVTGVAQIAFHSAANGSLIVVDGKPVGSRLLGQPFDDPKYFWSRLSATSPQAYNGASSSGSNLGPLSDGLVDAVRGRIDALKTADPENHLPIPVDLVTASGSGLDPHISPAAARYQVGRVARVRGLPEATVQGLLAQNTHGRQWGVFGEPVVDVLSLNVALDALGEK
jgi:K+-transporting ATPase ATPase C chain